MIKKVDFSKYENIIKGTNTIKYFGNVTNIIGQTILSKGPKSKIGDLCKIISDNNNDLLCEVIGFNGENILLTPYGEIDGISPEDKVIKYENSLTIPVGENLIGRIVDALGNPIDNKGPILGDDYYSINKNPPNPLDRMRIKKPLYVGIKAIDSLLTIGQGQRMGIFAGSGVGKSTLLGMIARKSEADINVIGLIGERGREVKEFIEKDLGEEGLKKTILVVTTSDKPAILRMKASLVATTIAEYFRDQGKNVMLMIDSLTRYAMATREVGLAAGELPVSHGYTSSMSSKLAKLLERTGNSEKGSITAIYTILVEGDEMNEPVADTARGILDGHIVMSRKLASINHYPAIDVLNSVSRVMPDIVSRNHFENAGKIQRLIAGYNKVEDLINIGAYQQGNNHFADIAIDRIDMINDFLTQDMYNVCKTDETFEMMEKIVAEV